MKHTTALALALVGLAGTAGARPAAVRLEIDPPAVTLAGPRAEQQLLVTACAPDGRRWDVTREVGYRGRGAVNIDRQGRIRPQGNGEGVIELRYPAQGTITARREVRVTTRGTAPAPPVSFVNEVIPALTHAGCNQGACHGSHAGKGGFRLSLLGFDPDADFIALTREGGSRRIVRAEPEQSLLIRKPTAAMPHGGGLRLPPGSPELRILRQWLREGARGPLPGERRVVRLAVSPRERVMARGERQQVRVTVTYSDGGREDVTGRTRFTTNNDAVVAVDGDGLLRGVASGAAAVVARYHGQVAVARVAVPFAARTADAGFPPPGNMVDPPIQAEWRRMALRPSPTCTDAEFIRRVSLDAMGTLPEPERVTRFVADRDRRKRERLVDEVLARPEWAEFWTLYFGDILRNNEKLVGEKGMWSYWRWMRDSLASGKPYFQMVRELVETRGSTSQNGAANFYNVAKTPEDLAETTSQVFLGIRLQCAKCHNHPFEKWTQTDYYQLASFFGGVKVKPQPSGTGALILMTAEGVVKHPRTGAVMAPRVLGGPEQQIAPADRTDVLAAWLADPHNPHVARNIVNRIWARLMGRGLIEPVDDIRTSNPPTHPALLEALTRDFVAGGGDLKRLMRTILTSAAYGLSAQATRENARDDQFYTHYLVRRLTAEQLMDAIGAVTGRPEKFPGFPAGYRTIALPDPALAKAPLLAAFGRPERVTACECERSAGANLSQTLYLINSDFVQRKIADPDGVVARLLAAGDSDNAILDALYLRAFARLPRAEERAAASRARSRAATRKEALEDLLWTLLNSQEFLLQH
jgi:Protein of unknown function (DUF1549)/Protein of unknown function (DUF1553)/Protein of unknown function (DUF1800)/Bacterial Ig-like domain (group 2)